MHETQVTQLALSLAEGAEWQWMLTALGNVHWSRRVDAASATPGSAWSIFSSGSRAGGAPAEQRAAERVSPAAPCPAASLQTGTGVPAGFAGQEQLLSCCVS